MKDEIWKDVPEFEGRYQISNKGRVKSVERFVLCGRGGCSIRKIKEKILKQFDCGNGYPAVTLSKDGTMFPLQYIHDLVLSAFVGPKEKGMECCHYDGSRDNNNLDNLRYGTRRENLIDDEIRLKGKLAARSLTQEQAKEVKTFLCKGINPAKIARKYKIDIHTLSSIKRGKTYNDIPWPNIPKKFYKRPLHKDLGTKSPVGRLSTCDVKKIKDLLSGELIKGREIAEMFNIHVSLVSRIKHKKVWFNV